MLPVVDLAQAVRDPAGFRSRLNEAAHEFGFFYLLGHGVQPKQAQEVFRLAREFFALPLEVKKEISQLNSPQFRGYSRLGGERTNGEVDWREQIDIGPERTVIKGATGYMRLEGPNQWPLSPANFRAVFEKWEVTLFALGQQLIQHWAVSLGAAQDIFDAAFANQSGTLIKVIHYPGRTGHLNGVGAHKDAGLLTLLLLEDDSVGLQVELSPGQWLDVPPLPGSFVVNIGELFEVATGGYLRATRHRVLAPPPGVDRLSVAYFFNPDLEAKVPIIELPVDLAVRCRGVEADPDNPIFHTYGENAWKSRTRAHPDVAERHHGITPQGTSSAY